MSSGFFSCSFSVACGDLRDFHIIGEQIERDGERAERPTLAVSAQRAPDRFGVGAMLQGKTEMIALSRTSVPIAEPAL